MNNLDYVYINEGSVIEKFIPRPEAPGLQENLDIGNDEQMIEAHQEAEKQNEIQVNGTDHHFITFIINNSNQLVRIDGFHNPQVICDNCSH